jgi:hypothetical protein
MPDVWGLGKSTGNHAGPAQDPWNNPATGTVLLTILLWFYILLQEFACKKKMVNRSPL